MQNISQNLHGKTLLSSAPYGAPMATGSASMGILDGEAPRTAVSRGSARSHGRRGGGVARHASSRRNHRCPSTAGQAQRSNITSISMWLVPGNSRCPSTCTTRQFPLSIRSCVSRFRALNPQLTYTIRPMDRSSSPVQSIRTSCSPEHSDAGDWLRCPARTDPSASAPPPPPGCIGRERTSEAAPEAVRQAVGGACQSGWGPLLSVTHAIWTLLNIDEKGGQSRGFARGCPGGLGHDGGRRWGRAGERRTTATASPRRTQRPDTRRCASRSEWDGGTWAAAAEGGQRARRASAEHRPEAEPWPTKWTRATPSSEGPGSRGPGPGVRGGGGSGAARQHHRARAGPSAPLGDCVPGQSTGALRTALRAPALGMGPLRWGALYPPLFGGRSAPPASPCPATVPLTPSANGIRNRQ